MRAAMSEAAKTAGAAAGLPGALQAALKEWAVVCEALASGRQIFLLRKGGIAEGKRGFELKHGAFALFPTWEHQQRDGLRPEFHGLFERLRPADPDRIEIRYAARVAGVMRAPETPRALLRAAEHHVWAEPYIRMRYEYRPDLPLWIVLTRVFRLPGPRLIENDRRYRGCRSWVDLYEEIDTRNSTETLDDSRFAAAREDLGRAMEN